MRAKKASFQVWGISALLFAFSLLMVFSFILFNILDIDGSDFPRAGDTRGQIVSLSESSHDFRRSWLHSTSSHPHEVVNSTSVVLRANQAQPFLSMPLGFHFLGVPAKHAFRRALPRASLDLASAF